MSFTFQDLIDAFFTGVINEGNMATPPSLPLMDKPALTNYLTNIYKARFERRKATLPSYTAKCAETLGRITFVMYRSEAQPEHLTGHQPDDPIDSGHSPKQIETRHIGLAREMYGSYTNSGLTPAPNNSVHGEIRMMGELSVRDQRREIDEPCPLCP